MPTEVFLEYLRKALESQKSLYDYLQLILPIASGFVLAVGGWFFAVWQNNQNTKFQLRKEQYYRSRESMTRIVTLFSDYLAYIYGFIKEMKNRFNNRIPSDEDFLNDFITENQMKMGFIHQLIRIEFPENDTGSKEITNQVKQIEAIFMGLAKIQNRIKEIRSTEEMEIINREVSEMNENASKIVEEITRIITVVEVKIIKALRSEAINLKIVSSK